LINKFVTENFSFRDAELMETMQRHVNETQSDCSDEFEKAENNTEKESSKAPLVMCVDSKNENDRESKSLLKMSSQTSHSIAYQLCSLTFTIPNSTNILVRGSEKRQTGRDCRGRGAVEGWE